MNTTLTTQESKECLENMLALSEEFDEQKADYTVPCKQVRFDDEGQMLLPEDSSIGTLFGTGAVTSPPLTLTDWSLNQICAKLGHTVGMNSLPTQYMRAIPKELLATCLNQHVTDSTNGDWFVRTFGQTARAVLSDRYGVLQNTELLDLLDQVIKEEANSLPNFKLVRPHIDPDSLHVKMVWRETDRPDGRGGNYGIGVYVRNGEIGNTRIGILPLIQRSSCTNSILLDKNAGIQMMHIGNMTSKRVQIKSAMMEIFPQAAAMLDKMIAAHEQELPSFTDVLTGLAKQHGWSDEVKMTVAAGTEGSSTRAGIVNGVSYAAHVVHKDDPDAMASMELLAGRILMAPDSVFHRAVQLAQVVDEKFLEEE